MRFLLDEMCSQDIAAEASSPFTSDRSMPRSTAGIGLLVRSIVEYAMGVADDDLANSYDWLPPAAP